MENSRKCYTDKTKSDVREQVRDALADILKKKNVVDVSVRDIISKSCISRSTFYRYYNSVDDAVKEIEDILLAEIQTVNELALIEKKNGDKAESFINNYARTETLKRNSKYIVAISGPNGDPQFEYKATKRIKEYLNKRYDYDKDPKYEFLVEFMAAGIYRIISYWIIKRPDLSTEEFLKIQYDTFGELSRLYPSKYPF